MMEQIWKRMIGALLCVALLAGCAPADPPTEPTQTSVTEPMPTSPAMTEPTVTEPAVTEPTATETVVTEPTITEPTVTAPTATAPTVTEPVPTDPGPTQTKPTDPKPTQPKPTDPGPTEPAPTEPSTTVPPLVEDTDGVFDVGVEKLPCSEETLFRKLFDPADKVSVDIQMEEEELRKLQQDYERYESFDSKSPIYRQADVLITVDGVVYRIREVGVRMKGNTSRTDFYDSDRGIYNAIHLKLDFQQTFDDEDYYGSDAKVWSSKDLRKARKARTFATLEELELRWNKCYDTTYLRESYSYEIYRSEGVLAPMAALCSLDWSGVHMGLYTMVEPVDKIFLQKRLSSKDLGGDLYKCSRKSSFTEVRSIGIEDEDEGEFYCYDLKTNKKTSQHLALKDLIAQLNSRVVTRESLAQVMDMENFLSYAAVSYFLGNSDDLRNNYNNFYIYFLKSSGKAIIIPYDLDQCLGSASGMRLTADDPFSDLQEGLMDPQPQENPMFNYTVVRGSFFVAEYAAALERVSQNKLLKPSTFNSRFQQAQGMYGADAAPSRDLDNMEGRDPSMVQCQPSDPKRDTTFQQYIEAKMEAFSDYMEQGYEDDDFTPAIPEDMYVVGSMNGWDQSGSYLMTWEDGIYILDLTLEESANWKIYHKPARVWLDASYLVDGDGQRGNIHLEAGTYRIAYDPYSMIITVSQDVI